MPDLMGTQIASSPGDISVLPAAVIPDYGVYGATPDIDTGTTPEDLWPLGGVYPFPAGAAVTSIVSTSPADVAVGAGARTVFVSGLDGAFAILTETVTMTGAVPVVLAGAYRRINRVEVVTAGASEANVGVITVTHPGPTVIAQMGPTTGKALQAIFTVPISLVNPRILSVNFSIIKQAASSIQALVQTRFNFDAAGAPIPDPAWVMRYLIGLNTQGTGTFQLLTGPGNLGQPVRIGTDFRFRTTVVTASNNAVGGGMTIVYDPPAQVF
ncbi:MAG: hypothetical protein GY906_22825 [bacterium]|nr:hypothetical protein [bacterium]